MSHELDPSPLPLLTVKKGQELGDPAYFDQWVIALDQRLQAIQQAIHRIQATLLSGNGGQPAREVDVGVVENIFTRDGQIREIQTMHIQGGAITAFLIADLAVETAKIAALAVDAAKIANATITQGKMANASIGTAQIIDANVTTAKIALLAVTTAVIDNLTVTTGKIGNFAVNVVGSESIAGQVGLATAPSWTDLNTVTVTPDNTDYPVFVDGQFQVDAQGSTGSADGLVFRLLLDGAVLVPTVMKITKNFTDARKFSWRVTDFPTVASHTYKLQGNTADTGVGLISSRNMSVQQAKK